ncbi:MAG: Two component signal transduction histidine kinase [Acidimicrobiaceae bacterium]|nr:Two component signal transduction histidine kinase [Acidimicrobiaceae bacterium]
MEALTSSSGDGAVPSGRVMPARQAWPGPSRLSTLGIAVMLGGLVLSGVLSWTTRSLYGNSEGKLLLLRVRDAGSLLSVSLPGIQTPLASAAATALATNGNARQFTSSVAPSVGRGRRFDSISLWKIQAGSYRLVAVSGLAPHLLSSPGRARTIFQSAPSTSPLRVTYVATSQPRLGYAITATGTEGHYAVYGEAALPRAGRLQIAKDSAFSDLDYALYVNTRGQSSHLVATSVARLPIRGESASVRIPFGDASLDLVMTPRGPLVGTFFADVPWIVLAVGVLLSIAAGLMTERLVRRRKLAENIADQLDDVATENQRLYDEQRTIAETLQHALLPQDLPQFEGLDISALYISGSDSVEVGGDWYDVLALDDDHVLVVVGDVSGRGLRAATIMASLRFATRAYAQQGDPPDAILAKLSLLLDVVRDGHFATVLCMVVDLSTGKVAITNAGHPAPLLVELRGASAFLDTTVGMPVGVVERPTYAADALAIPRDSTLLVFTDGLIERRGEALDVGLQRLRDATDVSGGSLEEFLSAVVGSLLPGGAEDDVAIVGLRWKS